MSPRDTPSAPRTRGWWRAVWKIAVAAAVVWYAVWRMLILTGHMHKTGEGCASLLTCPGGPCLVHRLDAAGALVATDGYCSRGCTTDGDCPPSMRCVLRPDGISRQAGDHLPFVTVPPRLCLLAPPTSTPAK